MDLALFSGAELLPRTSARSVSPPAARDSLASWLLSDAVQVAAGPQRGGVAGWVDADGGIEYVYPEASGYYLQWLASYASRYGVTQALIERASAAQDWLVGWLSPRQAALTRVYLRAAPPDWRNDALFCFDLAMTLRGLGSAARLGLIEVDKALLERLAEALQSLVGNDGLFCACIACEGASIPPQRWSTRRGGFLAKAAAGIIVASGHLPALPKELTAVARASFAAALDWMLENPHDEVHPLLYAMEGVLALPGHRKFTQTITGIAAQFRQLLAEMDRLGRVPESHTHAGAHRLDIVAQTLRVGTLLRAHGAAVAWSSETVDHLAHRLAFQVAPHGGIPFAEASERPQYNVWTAMFAEQALALRHDTPAHWADPESLLV